MTWGIRVAKLAIGLLVPGGEPLEVLIDDLLRVGVGKLVGLDEVPGDHDAEGDVV